MPILFGAFIYYGILMAGAIFLVTLPLQYWYITLPVLSILGFIRITFGKPNYDGVCNVVGAVVALLFLWAFGGFFLGLFVDVFISMVFDYDMIDHGWTPFHSMIVYPPIACILFFGSADIAARIQFWNDR